MANSVSKILESTTSGELSNKRQKFVKFAEKRTINAIKAIRTIGKLGNKSHYDFDDKDVKKIVSTLTKELDSLKMKMTNSDGKDFIEFKL